MALQAAVEQMNGAEVNEAHIEVEPAHGTPSSSGAVDEKGSARSCSIFVKGFGPEVGLVTSIVTCMCQVHLIISHDMFYHTVSKQALLKVSCQGERGRDKKDDCIR